MNSYDFNESDRKGKIGQYVITNWLKNTYYCIDYNTHTDVSLVKKYQKIDVDLLFYVEVVNEIVEILIEVKTECVNTGNLFYEWISNTIYNTKGCMRKTQADDIYFYYPLIKKVYKFNRKQFVAWAEPRILAGNYKIKSTSTPDKYTGELKPTLGYLIPLKELEEQKFCKVYDVEDFGAFDFLRE